MVEELQLTDVFESDNPGVHSLHSKACTIEPIIMKTPQYVYIYAADVIKDRWPEAEPFIMKDSQWAYLYARA